MSNIKQLDYILFAQHGWADTAQKISELARALATPKTLIVAPNLGYFKTWLRIEPLVDLVEQNAAVTIANYGELPIRIIGHSMGGLIWLEVLNRHPEWWQNIQSLVLIASPVGGADIARIIDPLKIGIGIARDLGINRRAIAEKIANKIPTLVIAGDVGNGSDHTITIESTKLAGAQSICLTGIAHPQLKNHSSLVEIIHNFWNNPTITSREESQFSDRLIEYLRAVPGMTDAHYRDWERAKTFLTFDNGLSIRLWKNPLQIEHVFLTNQEGKCLYAGFVGWLHKQDLQQALENIRQQYRLSGNHPQSTTANSG